MTAEPWDIPRAWEPARACARAGGTMVLVGGSDSGKSTLAALLACDAFEAGRRVMVVDADLGQSTIGPPACVGVGRLARSITSLSDLDAERIDFVGRPSPVGHLLGAVTSAFAMVQYARAQGAETVVVDTTGLIAGPTARALKEAKLRLLDPEVVIAVQAKDEVEHLLAPYRTRTRPEVLRLPPSRRVLARDRAARQAHRQRRFGAYFSAGRLHTLDWKQASVENTPWTAGEALPGHLQAHAADLLGQEVRYAERGPEGLLLFVAGPVPTAGRSQVEAAFGPTRVVNAAVLENLLVGLLGAQGETCALGIVEQVDFPARRLRVFTPLPDAEDVHGLRLGFLQLRRDGTQLSLLDPAELG